MQFLIYRGPLPHSKNFTSLVHSWERDRVVFDVEMTAKVVCIYAEWMGIVLREALQSLDLPAVLPHS